MLIIINMKEKTNNKLKLKPFCLFNLLEQLFFSYFVFIFGMFVLLFNPIFYIILFKLSGVQLPISLLFTYSSDLILYFLHLSALDSAVWSAKEVAHYGDVRSIIDWFNYYLVISIIFVGLNFRKINLSNLKFVSSKLKYIILLPLVVLPFFSYFWDNVFHKIMFSNDLWIMVPTDLSYHIFYYDFFILSYLSFVGVEFGLFYFINKKYNK